MSDLPPKGTPSLVIIISDSLIVASRILRLAVSFYSNRGAIYSFGAYCRLLSVRIAHSLRDKGPQYLLCRLILIAIFCRCDDDCVCLCGMVGRFLAYHFLYETDSFKSCLLTPSTSGSSSVSRTRRLLNFVKPTRWHKRKNTDKTMTTY